MHMVPYASVLAIVVAGHAGAQPANCTDTDRRALADASVSVQALDDGAALEELGEGEPTSCRPRRLARLAMAGWVEARALARVGGDPAALGEVNERLGAIEQFGAESAASLDERLGAEYAAAAIRAAVAAAQDERPEMELYLAHARDLSARSLAGSRGRVLWPLDIDLLEGELWLEVDWFDTALTAFERAEAARRGARAVVGLGRSQRRLADPGACATFARAGSMHVSPEVRRELDGYLAGCRG